MKCPRCGRPSSKEVSHRNWLCDWCDMLFDDDPDEGGTYCTDPTRRLENEEREKERRAKRAVERIRRGLR